MLLKRKRSEDELAPFSSSRVMGCASPMRSDHGDVVMMDSDAPVSPRTSTSAYSPSMQNRSRSCTPSHLPSRTYKRLRNGRPSEHQVHQNTLKMLYQAQQHPEPTPEPHHVFSSPVPTISMPSMPPPQPAPPAQNQPSLHNFWKLPTSAMQSHAVSTAAPAAESAGHSTACEDCGVGLSEEDAMMDDGYGFETYINACSTCARAVCFSCSVGNLNEQRRCLRCAGREKVSTEEEKKWVGGIGWTMGDVTVY